MSSTEPPNTPQGRENDCKLLREDNKRLRSENMRLSIKCELEQLKYVAAFASCMKWKKKSKSLIIQEKENEHLFFVSALFNAVLAAALISFIAMSPVLPPLWDGPQLEYALPYYYEPTADFSPAFLLANSPTHQSALYSILDPSYSSPKNLSFARGLPWTDAHLGDDPNNVWLLPGGGSSSSFPEGLSVGEFEFLFHQLVGHGEVRSDWWTVQTMPPAPVYITWGGHWNRRVTPVKLIAFTHPLEAITISSTPHWGGVSSAMSLSIGMLISPTSTDLPTFFHSIRFSSADGQRNGSPTLPLTHSTGTASSSRSSNHPRLLAGQSGSNTYIEEPNAYPSLLIPSTAYRQSAIAMTDISIDSLSSELALDSMATQTEPQTVKNSSVSSTPISLTCNYTHVDVTSHDVTTVTNAAICMKIHSSGATPRETHSIEIDDITFAGNHGECRIMRRDVIFYKPDVDFCGTDVCIYKTRGESRAIIIRISHSISNTTERTASFPPTNNASSFFSVFVAFVFFVGGGCCYCKRPAAREATAPVEGFMSPTNERIKPVYATPMPASTLPKGWIPNTDESGTMAPVEGFMSPTNERIKLVYATPMPASTRRKEWIPNTDESGVNPQFVQWLRAFDSFMKEAYEDTVTLKSEQGRQNSEEDHDDESSDDDHDDDEC